MKVIIIKAVLLLSVAFTIQSCSSDKELPEMENQQAISVQVKTITPTEIDNKSVYSGRIEAEKRVDLSTRLMGVIETLQVKVGDQVKKGDLVFTISNKDLLAKRSQLLAQKQQAQVGLSNIRKDAERISRLFEKKSATQKELDDITTAVLSAEANISSLDAAIAEVNSNLSYTNVVAPFSGEVAAKMANVGDLSSPGTPVVSLVSKNYKAVVTVSENQIYNLKLGDKVTLIVPSLKSTVQAEVTQISPSGAFNAGQFSVTVVPIESNEQYKDGLFAQVELSNATQSIILLNKNDIVTRGQLQGVYVLGEDNSAVLNWIRLGNLIGEKWTVLSGVKPGEKIIYNAKGQLKDGQKVVVK